VSATWSVVGAGAILPRVGYGCSGYVLRPAEGAPVTLFDCGPGTIRNLPALGVSLGEVRRVVLSHFHPDHCLDVFALAFARYVPGFDAPPMELIGPRGLSAWLARGAEALGRWVEFQDTRIVEVEPADEVQEFELADLRLRHVHTRHTDTSLAWRAELADGASVTYSGDSGETAALIELARECDLFACECSFPEEEAVPNHLTPAGAGRLARAAAVRRLLLTHFYPSQDPDRARHEAGQVFDGPIETARDGGVYLLRT
jgi:ribonuclease BN (tRNA processing enzyme)